MKILNLERFISNMMTVNVLARIWHWKASSAQHHVTYESFLNENEKLVDRLVESALGNDISISFEKVGVKEAMEDSYSLENSVQRIKNYRLEVSKMQSQLSSKTSQGNNELTAILDDVIELASKTLYLLKLD